MAARSHINDMLVNTSELVPWGTPARMHRGDGRLLGRRRESDQIHRFLTDPDGPRLVLVRGERGAGRTAFLTAVGERLRAHGTAVRAVDCVLGDGERPLLLALRLVMALEEHHSPGRPHRPASELVSRALSAVDRCDRTAMDAVLRAALARPSPVAVMVDDAQHADTGSLAVLSGIDWPRLATGARLVVGAVRHGAPSTSGPCATAPAATGTGHGSTPPGALLERDRAAARDGMAAAVEQLSGAEGVRTVLLAPLGPQDTTALAAQWLTAQPDTVLARRVGELTRGIPGAVDALLTAWTRRDEIRTADRRAFLHATTPVPVLPDDDRFVTAVDVLGEPYRAVAAALSVLGPLGPAALPLAAEWAGLSASAAGTAVRHLVAEGVLDELPAPDGAGVRGWTFRLPLTAHTVRERLRPRERSRLSATAVRVLWADAEAGRGAPASPVSLLLDGQDARAYRADRIADAGILVDRERAAAELASAAQQSPPGTDDRAVLRWLRAAAGLTERHSDRDAFLQQCGTAAYRAGDYPAGRAVAETLLRDPGESLPAPALQEIASMFTALTANQRDWRQLSRLATAHWWDDLPVPALAKVTGQALALCRLARWQEAAELLSRTEADWNTDPRARAAPGCFKAVAELALGRPEAFRHGLTMPDAPELPPGKVYVLADAMFVELAVGHDLKAAEALLQARALTVEMLPPISRFLHHHLAGRWDQALEAGRRLLAAGEVQTPGSDSCLLPARTAAILLARGRVTSALNLVVSRPGPAAGPPQWSLSAAEAEVLTTLGDLEGAEQALRRGLDAAQARAQLHGSAELWAALAEVTAETGRTGEAATHLRHLRRIVSRTGDDRTRLRYLLAAARTLAHHDPDSVHGHLREAMELARHRGLPFETATTLVATATMGAGPATLLHEAYDLFGMTGATLWRSRTRTAMRDAGLTVPGRGQTTAENDHLLATLVAEQLTNRQIATVLRLNEDAVARRLSRLFTRTGQHSRTELATAVLTGSL
ncbi:AAA family ATPase [Streptomyces sp. NPDC051987]|uniref:AAA family ATPase n=1 Tax=Streptomyces sp. NPDC051987 TaxID=3155808 RepID=UPI00344174F7